MTAWGKTGRVELRVGEHVEEVASVYLDETWLGSVWNRVSQPQRDHVPSLGEGWLVDLSRPSLDAAVMCVLQHAGTSPAARKWIRAVWRAERDAVVTVRRVALNSSSLQTLYAWRFYGGNFIFDSDFETAVRNAERHARRQLVAEAGTR